VSVVRGGIQRTAPAYESMVTQTIGIGVGAQAIFQDQLACLEVLVQNDPDSAATAYIGNEFGQYVALPAGDSITVPINNVNRIYARAGAGGATINWIAMTLA